MNGDGLEAHPDLGAAGASMREKWRAEQEAAMKDAVESRAHRLTLQDRFREHMHRGDRIAVTVAGRRIAGVPEEIGADLLAVRTLFARVDIHLSPTIPFSYELVEKRTARWPPRLRLRRRNLPRCIARPRAG